ncbi:OLC1v1014240C1 [Oldenlandia corymbosa var. corymbosa]|uniref:OLC1v1014240C1 n=1 Tax=Oldenlandia corymbosa var. corymbosa TaxID=529605 RepID=A0AAV1E0L2_OLDCO|nr:OLC1v1014240C1 [Oldenlandia corymbosa var. corymbosa]
MMIISNYSVQRTYYDILGVREDASFDEIRSAYRSSVLSSHPDKLLQESELLNSSHGSGNKFIEVQQAWKILSNPRDRGMYDIELQKLRDQALTCDDVRLEDFSIEESDDSLELSYSCRCGDYFVIDSSELMEVGYSLSKKGSEFILHSVKSLPASVILPCGSCSLKILLSIDVNDSLQIDGHFINSYSSIMIRCFMENKPILPMQIESEMDSGEEGCHWSVFDGIKKSTVRSASPEALMAEINSAISSLEYAHSTAYLQSVCSDPKDDVGGKSTTTSNYDARMADEAYKLGLAAMASGKLNEAIQSLNVALTKCPPDKTSAIAKIRSLISLTSQQLQKSSN